MSSSNLVGSPHTLTAAPASEYKLNFSYVESHNVFVANISGPTFLGLQFTVQKDGVSVGGWIQPTSSKFRASSACPTYLTHTNSDPTTSENTAFLWKPTTDLKKGDIIQPNLWIAIDSASIHSVAATGFILIQDGAGSGAKVNNNAQLLVICLGIAGVAGLHLLLSLLECIMNRSQNKKKQSVL
jgi:hypothetical protein